MANLFLNCFWLKKNETSELQQKWSRCRKSKSEDFLFADSCEKVSCFDVWLKSCSVKFASLPTARGFQLRAVGGCGGHGEAACAGIPVGLQVFLNLICMQYHIQTLQMTNKHNYSSWKVICFFFGGNLGRYLLGNASLQKRWVSFRNLCLKECLGVSAQDRFWGPQLHRAWLVAEVKVWTLETGIFPKTIWKELQETLISGGFPMG